MCLFRPALPIIQRRMAQHETRTFRPSSRFDSSPYSHDRPRLSNRHGTVLRISWGNPGSWSLRPAGIHARRRRRVHRHEVTRRNGCPSPGCRVFRTVNWPGLGSDLSTRKDGTHDGKEIRSRLQRACAPHARRSAARACGAHAASNHLGELLGVSPDTLRVWYKQTQIDSGAHPGVTTDMAEENRRLRREVSELRKANEVLKAASIFFAKELDQPRSK